MGFVSAQYDYKLASSKSLLFYEAERTGALPADNRISWRKSSFLDDGKDDGVDLSGGYFDGENPFPKNITNIISKQFYINIYQIEFRCYSWRPHEIFLSFFARYDFPCLVYLNSFAFFHSVSNFLYINLKSICTAQGHG